ncbi:hypothetical protein CLE01_33020 [Cryobacterium levicorallinum]|nr:hypothetical protein CLE01_33020 [Cryobacterium levicorallinum]
MRGCCASVRQLFEAVGCRPVILGQTRLTCRREYEKCSLYFRPFAIAATPMTSRCAQLHSAGVVVLLGNVTAVALTAVTFRYEMGRFHALFPPAALADLDQPGNAAS